MEEVGGTTRNLEDAQRLVVAGRGDLLARRRVVDVDDGRNVVLVDVEREVERAHVERVQTAGGRRKETF